MKKTLIITGLILVVMCLLVPVSCAKAPTPTPAPPPSEVIIPPPPEPPTPPGPRFAIPQWALYTIIGSGGLFLFGLGYWLGRRTVFYY